MKNTTRREFVKASALAGGGLLTSPLSIEQIAYGHTDDNLKLAVIGCGGRGTGAVIQALTADDNITLVAMADAFADQIDNSISYIQEHFDGNKSISVDPKNRFSGFDAYKKAIDLADVVILTTPPGFRPQHFKYAIDNDKHVFMEKPVATDAYGVRQVLKTAKEAKKKNLNVVVGLQRHYENSYLELLKRIRQDDIGRIVSGQVYWNSGGVWVRPRTPQQSELEYQMRNWYYFNWLCGDHILEQHIHNIDVANWFKDAYPVSAQGMGGRQVRTGIDHGEIFDHHFVEFTYADGTIISSQCRHQPNTMNRVQEVFQGTKGTIITGDNATMQAFDGSILYEHDPMDDPNPYQVEHDKLFAAIRNGDVIADAENGAKTTMTAIMGRMATYTGQVIRWEDALNDDQRLVPDDLTWESTAPVLPNAQGRYKIPMPGVV